MLRILEISVSGCSLCKVFALKNGLCENFAMASFPPDRRILQIPCGLGRRAGKILPAFRAFYKKKSTKTDGEVSILPNVTLNAAGNERPIGLF